MNHKSFIGEVWGWFKLLVIAFAAAMLINAFVVQAYRVQGQSMLPTLHNDDYTVLYKLSGAYKYGDIVVIDSRLDQHRTLLDDLKENGMIALITGEQDEHLWIKRVIGLPGDTLEFDGNRLYRNGRLLNESYINEQMTDVSDRKITVPPGHIFVMGDNRNHSSDSRVIGSIPLGNVLGKMIFKK